MEQLATRFNKQVFEPYLDFVRGRYRFHTQFKSVEALWNAKLNSEELIKGPFLEKAQSYESVETVADLDLADSTKITLKEKLGKRRLFVHQFAAVKKVLEGKNIIVATGTSSGKTLCYQLPIIDDLVKNPGSGIRAIIIYPLNALVNDQLNEWEQLLSQHPSITYARFTGQTPADQTEYVSRLKARLAVQARIKHDTEFELDRMVSKGLHDELQKDDTIRRNRLNHREKIRTEPPNILITNFSMLEYLLERPIDSPIFDRARLKFLVLDEVHAYRGAQATEIAFLVRRIKERLGVSELSCIGTSATLGTKDSPESVRKVSAFAESLFNSVFDQSDIIYGETAKPRLIEPSFDFTPEYYISLLAKRQGGEGDHVHNLDSDRNLFRLKSNILTKPILLQEAAELLWPNQKNAKEGLQAFLEIVATEDNTLRGDHSLLPTRLHYFVKAQEGLYVCLNPKCPGRHQGHSAYFVTRTSDEAPSGFCPECAAIKMKSVLVEVVICRKCGYLFGVLQDLGPARTGLGSSQATDQSRKAAHFDSFSTEISWGAESFWTYFSISPEFPSPSKDDIQDELSLVDKVASHKIIEWCASCGKKRDAGEGDNCICSDPILRTINIVHRQCPSDDFTNLEKGIKEQLPVCPNCATPSNGGFEPLRRLQESDEETGLAMAIPLAHFRVSEKANDETPKLLCFTDNRQRAAAFPTLLEEESFDRVLGRKIVEIVNRKPKGFTFVELGEALYQITDEESESYDQTFRLPVSRFPENIGDFRPTPDLWVTEVFGYFGVPDAARDSVEDIGLVAVEYRLEASDWAPLESVFSKHGVAKDDAWQAFQTLCGYLRKRKAFTLPTGRVDLDAPAFGSVLVDIGFKKQSDGSGSTYPCWLPKTKNNIVTYLSRILERGGNQRNDAIVLAKDIWDVATGIPVFKETTKGLWKLYHDHFRIIPLKDRFVCDTCGAVSVYSAEHTCANARCNGNVSLKPFELEGASLISRWVGGSSTVDFGCLQAEEHTAQINKDDAKAVEDDFRSNGLNLLSSTTTFEMGINIGDLQKVLLRNAPPNSASYVQRIGRAGRGEDKNAICVTLCRRNKYDLDQWNNPTRLMGGVINPATVFVANNFIGQRHANAMIFSRFLRLLVESGAVDLSRSQKVSMKAFLSPDILKQVPEVLRRSSPLDYYDYTDWLSSLPNLEIAKTEAGKSILESCGGALEVIRNSQDFYVHIIRGLEDELAAMLKERGRLYKLGVNLQDIEASIKGLLEANAIDVLARRGFLPKYAFPLDVVTLETSMNRWTKGSGVELSRDRGVAISEFAPGSQVVARKRVYTSQGLYKFGDKTDLDLLWFSQCRACGQIRCDKIKSVLEGPCPVCKGPQSGKSYTKFIQPEAFSIAIDYKSAGGKRDRRNRLITQRQPVTHFIDLLPEEAFLDKGQFWVGLKRNGLLFRYNAGPEGKGFMVCPQCGYCRAMRDVKGKSKFKHNKLRFRAGDVRECKCETSIREVAFGHKFTSFCLIIRPKAHLSNVGSLSYALQRGLCDAIEVEPNDIGVSWRWRADHRGGDEPEIVLYDLTPGGSGFCEAGMDAWENVVEKAARAMQECKCVKACYDCLKSYGNQAFHDVLDREIALAALKG